MTAFLGRERELERLVRAVDSANAGSGRVFLLSGEPGIGKTRLADEAAQYARTRGTRTIWGRAWEGGGAPPFWPWIQIARGLSSVVDPPPELARLLPELGAPSPFFTTNADRFVVADAMLRFVRDAAAREPVLLLFDDLHAADIGTVLMLGFVAPELAGERVLAIGTYRDVEARLQPEVGDALAVVGRAGEVVRLGRLGREDVAALARETVTLDERELDALYARTEGNPLFVAETVRALASEGRGSDGSLPLTDGVRAAIRMHLARASATVRQDLDVAAVIGREFTASVLAPLVDTSPSELVARLSEAASAGFLVERMPSRFAFVHGLFREVLLADLGSRAAAIHARAAKTLETMLGGDPTALAEIARHWLEAGPDHASRARDAAIRAAEAASASLAYAEAADLYERALDAHTQASPGDARGRAEAWLSLGDARIRAGETRRGKEACERAAEIARALGDVDLLVRAALGHGSDFVAGARDRELASLLEEALAAAGDRPDLRARLLARRAAALQPARDPREPIRMAKDALALLDESFDDATRLSVLHNASGAMVDFVDPYEREPIDEEAARLAQKLGEPAVRLRALQRLYHDHSERGDLAGAAARLDAYELAAQKWPQPHVRMPALLGRSCLALLRGRVDESARLVAEARRIADRTRDRWLDLAVKMHEIASLRIRNGVDELARRRVELHAVLDVFPDYGASFDAMVHALSGDRDATRAALDRLDAEHVRICMDTMMPTWVAEAAAFLGDARWGALAEEALAPLGSEWNSWSGVAFIVESPVARGRAFAARARGDRAAERKLWADAIAGAERAGATIVVARVERERRGAPSAAEVSFAHEGDTWNVSGEGGTARIKDSRGVQMLAALVATPFREHHVLDLASASDEPIDSGDAGELLDEQARRAYRARILELTNEREEAERDHDPGRVARVRAELEAIEAELSRGVGLGGRARRAGKAAERARVNVQRRLAEAIKRIESLHPPLGRHLRTAVKTGAFCSYDPSRASDR